MADEKKKTVVFQCKRLISGRKMPNLFDLQLIMEESASKDGVRYPERGRVVKANKAGQYIVKGDDKDYTAMVDGIRHYHMDRLGLVEVGAEQEGKMPVVETTQDVQMRQMNAKLTETLAISQKKDGTVFKLQEALAVRDTEIEEMKKQIAALQARSK